MNIEIKSFDVLPETVSSTSGALVISLASLALIASSTAM